MPKPISRKTLAAACGGDITAETIRRNERRWALDRARCSTGTRRVLYDADKAIRQLRARGLA